MLTIYLENSKKIFKYIEKTFILLYNDEAERIN